MPQPQHPGRTVHELQIANATLVAAVYNDWNGMYLQHSIYTCTTGLLVFGITHLPTHFAERRAKGDVLGRSLKGRARQCSVSTMSGSFVTHVHAGTRRARLVCQDRRFHRSNNLHVKESSKSTLVAHQQAHAVITSKLDWHLGMGGAVMAAGLRGGRRTQRETTDFGILSATRTLFYIPRNQYPL